jgi:hypothetical protein
MPKPIYLTAYEGRRSGRPIPDDDLPSHLDWRTDRECDGPD